MDRPRNKTTLTPALSLRERGPFDVDLIVSNSVATWVSHDPEVGTDNSLSLRERDGVRVVLPPYPITRISLLAVIFSAFLLATTTHAAQPFGEPPSAPPAVTLPDYYPPSFQYKGTIQSIENDTLVIGGVRYRLSPNVLVHTLDTEFAPRQALTDGMEIAFTQSRTDPRGHTVTEIWVLPAGTIPPH